MTKEFLPTGPSIPKKRKMTRGKDGVLPWMKDIPEFEPWRDLCLGWVSASHGNTVFKLRALLRFMDRFLLQLNLPLDPAVVLRKDTQLPDFFEAACPKSAFGAQLNNLVRSFLDYVLWMNFSPLNDAGIKTLDPNYHNPIHKRHWDNHQLLPGKRKELASRPRSGIRAQDRRDLDPNLAWISRNFPELENWRELGTSWLGTLPRVGQSHLICLYRFIDQYLFQQNLPIDPSKLLRKDFQAPDFFEVSCPHSKFGVSINNRTRTFLAWVLEEHYSHLNSEGKRVLQPGFHNPIKQRDRNSLQPISGWKGPRREHDLTFSRFEHDYPEYEPWRALAAEWISGVHRGVPSKVSAIAQFLENFLVRHRLPKDPPTLLSRTTPLPEFFGSVCSQSREGIKVNNIVHDFLNFVLAKLCSDKDDFGRLVISPAFWNPVPIHSGLGIPQRDETVRSPLPYGYIDNLRRILAGGNHFGDWKWAQTALGAPEGTAGTPAPDWFPVTWDQIDKEDPDCVWRIRPRTKDRGGDILEMWSPVRWVALLIKLILPLRTFQVRMLDSGEADTFRYEGGMWVDNPSRLREGRPGKPRQLGVFRKTTESDGSANTELYINTNKTADIGKSGGDMGYVFPWPSLGDNSGNPYYWFEKLRTWQEKYNPIDRLAHWTELTSSHLGHNVKSEIQLSAYPATAFLFRMREAKPTQRHLPLFDTSLHRPWYELLSTLQNRLSAQGSTHETGRPIRLVPPPEDSNDGNTTYFPLHSLRVSLITALAQDGEMRPELLMKIVGHSRLLMTLYYIRYGESHIRMKLEEARARLEAKKDISILRFLADSEHTELLKNAICISPESLQAALPTHPSSRNPAGWELMLDGVCLMGGNTSQVEANTKIGGCFNGGPLVEGTKSAGHGPVPGGPRNCIRCRWFVTMPHYLFGLQARFNNLAYREFETRIDVQACAQKLQDLENIRHDAEQANLPFDRSNELRHATRLQETTMARWQELILDLSACQSLMVRCAEALEPQAHGSAMVSVGSASDVRCVLEDTNSELLQLSGVCEDLELYADLPPLRDAVFRRSQLLDAALQREDHRPLFLHLPERVQLQAGNAWLKAMSLRANPTDPELGRRKVISLIETQEGLFKALGFDVTECLPDVMRGIQSKQSNHVAAKQSPQLIRRMGNVLYDEHSS